MESTPKTQMKLEGENLLREEILAQYLLTSHGPVYELVPGIAIINTKLLTNGNSNHGAIRASERWVASQARLPMTFISLYEQEEALAKRLLEDQMAELTDPPSDEEKEKK